MPALSIQSQEKLRKLQILYCAVVNSAEIMNLMSPTTSTVFQPDVIKVTIYSCYMQYK